METNSIDEILLKVQLNSESSQEDDDGEAPDTEFATVSRKMPDISAYNDALLDGKPLFTAGDFITIEMYTRSGAKSPNRWYDTRTYTVKSINSETGDVVLYDPDYKQSACTNFITAPQRGDVLKLTPKVTATPKKPFVWKGMDTPSDQPVSRRGRKKGTKNRPKDVIQREKDIRTAKNVDRANRSSRV